jgi:deoxyribose-phosphate aldolase
MRENRLISTSRIQQMVSLIDLTNLSDDCDQAAIKTLCAQTETPVGHVAAVCVWPAFVADVTRILGQNSPVRIATVVNFPSGDEPLETTCAAIEKALNDGANEIDYVLPYNALINGNKEIVTNSLQKIRSCTPEYALLKVILETGKLNSSELIRTAANIAIEQGADFIKTSTGKAPVNATLESATIMLDAIAQTSRNVGFKAAGGIKTAGEANAYLNLSEELIGQDWANSSHFRFGASSLLQDALSNLKGDVTATSMDGGEY